jgi:uncharacterized protein YfkK (UPF0435 family)
MKEKTENKDISELSPTIEDLQNPYVLQLIEGLSRAYDDLEDIHAIIDRLEKYSHKTVHAPNYVLVLKSDLDNLIRERNNVSQEK